MHPFYKLNKSETVAYAPLPLPPSEGMTVPVHGDIEIRKGKCPIVPKSLDVTGKLQ